MTSDFLKDAAERFIRVVCFTLLAQFGADVFDVRDVAWGDSLAIAGGAGLFSLLTSLAAIKLGSKGTASLTKATVTATYADNVARGRHAARLTDGPA